MTLLSAPNRAILSIQKIFSRFQLVSVPKELASLKLVKNYKLIPDFARKNKIVFTEIEIH